MNAVMQAMPLPLPVWRSRAVLLLLLIAFGVLIGRAVYLQGLNYGFLQQKGESRYSRVIELPATRGVITEPNMDPHLTLTPSQNHMPQPPSIL